MGETMGEVIGIARHDRPGGSMETLERAAVDLHRGIDGDRGGLMTNRKVSVLFDHQWRAALAEIGAEEQPWTVRRANLLVRGVENPRRAGARLRVGEALLEVSMECDPCERMDAQIPGLQAALTPDWRGGVCCRVIEGGEVAVGAAAALTTPEMAGAGVLGFWLNEIGRKGWYLREDAIDQAIRERFAEIYEAAARGALDGWRATPDGALALIILLDQFPRNMFRDDPRAFATDAKAREIAHEAIGKGFDLRIAEPERMMFYMPLEHSEDLADQDRSVALFAERMPSEKEGVRYAEAHRDVIRRFGRFPMRNAALGRASTPAEQVFIDAGGRWIEDEA